MTKHPRIDLVHLLAQVSAWEEVPPVTYEPATPWAPR
jgi:hypothetical protein